MTFFAILSEFYEANCVYEDSHDWDFFDLYDGVLPSRLHTKVVLFTLRTIRYHEYGGNVIMPRANELYSFYWTGSPVRMLEVVSH